MKTQTTTNRTARHHHSHFLSRRLFTNQRTREPSVMGWVGADEAALDVTVDFSRSFPSVGSLRDRPCADFVFARGQKTDQIQKGVGRMDKSVSRRLFDADFFQERLAVALFELCDFHFHLAD